DRLIPRNFVGAAVLVARSRVEEAIRRLDLLVAPAAAIAGVTVVDAALPEVGRAANDTLVGLDVDRAANVAEAADRLGGIQLPRVMAEVAIGEGTDRADSDAHTAVDAGAFLEHVLAEGGRDRWLERAVGGFDGGDAGDLVALPRTSTAPHAP